MANHFENIDRYFGGEMGAEEMQQFENTINQDPILEKEFSFQQELVEGIQAARKAELKATLNSIDITGASALESGALTKILGSVVVVGIVAVGAYLYFGEEEVATATDKIDTTAETLSQETTNNEESAEAIEIVTTTPTEEESVEQVDEDNTPTLAESNNQSGEVEISEANVTDSFEDENEVSETEAPLNHMIAKSKVTISTLDVTVEESKRYSFHYQVKNNVLSLYGDFSSLYEIIEFHKDGNISTYFKYDNKYYEIDKQQSKATPLVELTGDGLLSLLDSIENNKER